MLVLRGKKFSLTAIATWRGEVRQTQSHGHCGYSKLGKAMELWRKWMITGIGGETNRWALDTPQVVGVQQISWLVRVYRG